MGEQVTNRTRGDMSPTFTSVTVTLSSAVSSGRLADTFTLPGAVSTPGVNGSELLSADGHVKLSALVETKFKSALTPGVVSAIG